MRHISEIRYVYAKAASSDAAYEMIDALYANGDVSACERPQAEYRSDGWCVTIVDIAATAAA